MKDYLFITSKLFPGVSAVGWHGSSLGLWDVVNIEDLHRPNDFFDYTTWIFGAYHESYERLFKIPGMKKVCCWTSSPGQVGFREKEIFNHVMELAVSGVLSELWLGSKEIFEVLKEESWAHYMPYPIDLGQLKGLIPSSGLSDLARMRNVALFCPDDPRKNIVVQYQGFLLAQREYKSLVLHTNVIKDQPAHFINNYGWLSQKDYFNVLHNCGIVLAVFPFESLAYSVIEAVMMGCIPIVSVTVEENLFSDNSVIVENVDSPIHVSKQIIRILKWSSEKIVEERKNSLESLECLAQRHNAGLKKFLSERSGV